MESIWDQADIKSYLLIDINSSVNFLPNAKSTRTVLKLDKTDCEVFNLNDKTWAPIGACRILFLKKHFSSL